MRPVVLLDLLLAFMRIGALSFGGAYAAVPLVEREVVSAGWMSASEFADLVAIDELTPGPILINSATFVGMRCAGLAGAIVATLGCVLPACLITLALVRLASAKGASPVVAGALGALACMAFGLIASTLATLAAGALALEGGIDLAAALLVVLAYACLRRYRPSPTLVVLASGCVAALAHLAHLVFGAV